MSVIQNPMRQSGVSDKKCRAIKMHLLWPANVPKSSLSLHAFCHTIRVNHFPADWMLSVSASAGVMVLPSKPPRWYCWLSAALDPYLAWFREPTRNGWAS